MTPSTNRGVNFPVEAAGIGLGWLAITFRAHTDSGRGALLRQVLHAVGVDDPRPRARGIRGYDQALDVLTESAVGWTDDRPREVHLTLKQADCSWERFAALLQVADGAESWQASRVDLNYDDQERTALPGDVEAAVVAGDVITRADRRVHSTYLGGVCQSVYVGAMSSDRTLNVYDKDQERADRTRGPVELGRYGVRWELRLKDDRATRAVRDLRQVAEPVSYFWQSVCSLVDFVDRRGVKAHHTERAQRLAWFAELTGAAARLKPYRAREAESETRRYWRLHRWLFTCAAAVAELQELAPNPLIIRELLADGADRLAQRRARAASRIHAA